VEQVKVRRLEVLFPSDVNRREYAIACAVWSALHPTRLVRDSSPERNGGTSGARPSEAFDEEVQGS
jgi:hypothetical protein